MVGVRTAKRAVDAAKAGVRRVNACILDFCAYFELILQLYCYGRNQIHVFSKCHLDVAVIEAILCNQQYTSSFRDRPK